MKTPDKNIQQITISSFQVCRNCTDKAVKNSAWAKGNKAPANGFRTSSFQVHRQSALHQRALHQLAMQRSNSRKYTVIGIIFYQQSRQICLFMFLFILNMMKLNS